jgi:ribosomal protein S18 acetylase RimI-like enzyme
MNVTEPTGIRVVPAGPERDAFLELFWLADDSEAQVRSYYQEGDLYVLTAEDGTTLGITLAIPEHEGSVELKAVAIAPDRQGQGVGQRMLALVIADLRGKGASRLVVGTGNSSIGQIAFYQKAGFRLWAIERDFFSPSRGYPDGIRENGILLRDMVWFDQDLT